MSARTATSTKAMEASNIIAQMKGFNQFISPYAMYTTEQNRHFYVGIICSK
jgi:hypothetical protein